MDKMMKCEIEAEIVQQLIDMEFENLRAKLQRARSNEEQTHLIIDTQHYLRGLQDFYLSVVPSDRPAHALAAGQVDEEALIPTILDAAIHQAARLLEQAE